ncbi:MAG: N-6 DNA Methylase [Syntrophus sp. PtaB.Bin075]|nr:MAG: N-6 DNA Methylase [Syntrophus sp. PtaB.Bin075]
MSKDVAPHRSLLDSLQSFAEQLTDKFSAKSSGEPEDQLKSPVDQLFTSYGKIISRSIILKGESTLDDRLGRPDFAAHSDKLPIGYIELKAPGKGANPKLFKGHDRDQWKRFQNVPNLIYTDGNEWALYRNGELVAKRVRLVGDIRSDGRGAVSEENAKELFQLFADFTAWTPIIPKKPRDLAAFLAPFCRLIRDEVMDSLLTSSSPMHSLKREIKALLFPDANDDQFADAYAQTLIFALLLGQMEGADVLDLYSTYEALENHHSLLSRSLQFLTDKEAREEISTSLSMAQRVIHEILPDSLKATSATKDPWLFFYEDFLASYDPQLRKEAGVYFTPLEVVRCQVRLIDEILQKQLGRNMGFVEAGVSILDPAAGTGTYLLGIIEHSLARVAEEEGPGAVKGGARSLTHNLHGFEWMVGPYSVAQLRISQALIKQGISLPSTGPSIYLTNTLESPHTMPPAPPLFTKPIALEHERALKVKESEQVLVCLGNPPYGRHKAGNRDNQAFTGGWVRYGDDQYKAAPILESFLKPARDAGYSLHLKNLYNLYIYFIRWSLWKVFEHKTATGPGILSFITASSYIDGDAFVGVREHMRRICDHIDIIDLGGEGRGTRKDENVFAIQTPVAIFLAWRKAKPKPDIPATVRYIRVEGTREEKLATLDAINSSEDFKWENVSNEWQSAFKPISQNDFAKWPNLIDIFPWQNNGVQCKRTWPIAPDMKLLKTRWKELLKSSDISERATAMRETGDRTIWLEQIDLFDNNKLLPALNTLSKDAEIHKIVRYSYRSFDRQYLLADNRFISRPRKPLWKAHSDKQIYMTALFSIALDTGPALVACSAIPDLDCFRGSFGAKAIIPIYRDAAASQANILPGLLEIMTKVYCRIVNPQDFAGYVYAILGQPEYTRRFAEELASKEVRVPLTKDEKLFTQASEFGKQLIWLHTYGERLHDGEHLAGYISKGKAKCTKAVSDQEAEYPNEFHYDETDKKLHVGDGEFAPVFPEVWEFEVSGLKVVQSWLGYRMRERIGKKSSPLDDIRPRVWTHEFTRELLELLWVLEETIEGYPMQKQLLEAVLESELFTSEELPTVPDDAREAPKVKRSRNLNKQIDMEL